MLVKQRLEEMTFANGLDSKFQGPGPAQYTTIPLDFNGQKNCREKQKPKFSFGKQKQYPDIKSRSPGPGRYESHDTHAASWDTK